MAKQEITLTSLLDVYNAEKEDEFVPTGIPTLDLLLGGGISPGSLYAFWGDKGSGKSTIALQVLRQFLRNGDNCVFIDVERSLNVRQQECFGIRSYVESGQLLHMQATTFSDADTICSACVKDKERKVKLVVIDSNSMLLPAIPDDLDIASERPGQKAKQSGALLTRIKSTFYNAGIACIVIFHARANISMGPANPYAPSSAMEGGFVAGHAPDAIVAISAGSKIKDKDDRVIGQVIHLTTDKNKFAPPFQKYDSKLFFGVGIRRTHETVDWCLRKGIITKINASTYEYPTPDGEAKSIRGYDNLFNIPLEHVQHLYSLLEPIMKGKEE